MQGPGRRLRPPRGKLLHKSFVFLNPFGRPSPVFGRRSAGRGAGCSGVTGFGGQLPLWGGGGGARGNCKFVRSQASALSSRPKLPHSSRGWSRVPVWAVRASPVTPGAKAAGDPGAANRAVGPGRGGVGGGAPAELRRSPVCPIEWSGDRKGGGYPRGFSNSRPREGGRAGTGFPRAAAGPRLSSPRAHWTCVKRSRRVNVGGEE